MDPIQLDHTQIRGRGLKKPYASITATEDGVAIRVDCEVNEEFWLEIDIPDDVLERIYAARRLKKD